MITQAVTVSVPVLVCTHLAVGLLGVWSGKAVTRYAAPYLDRHLSRNQEPTMDDTEAPRPRTPRGPTAGAVILVILLAAAVLVGFGIQQSAFQRAASDRDSCYEEWGRDLATVNTASRGATVALDRARERRDNAVDSIVLVFIGLRAHPPKAHLRDLNAVLVEFAAAKANLDKVTERVKQTRVENQPPRLHCVGSHNDPGTATNAPD